ncbi:MAG: NAD(P)-dependent oxidoreductase [Candidatus Daviesbacteria bacterium]|nr:NAD(P)-dependent oxidoreductase [Candidatus Daviesbacteria bacterium]
MKQKLLIFGGAGLIGSKFIEKYKDYFEIDAPTIDELDILNKPVVTEYIKNSGANLLINYAAYTDVDKAEAEKGNKEGIVYRLNSEIVKDLCEICKPLNMHYIHFSTDYVFDGEKADSPYTEEDKPNPLSWYGETKYFAEQFILESNVKSTIIRTSMPFSSHFDLKQDIARIFLKLLKDNQEIVAINDQMVTPVFVDDLANALKTLIEEKEEGIYHVVCSNYTTPFDLAKIIAEKFGLDSSLVKPTEIAEYNKTREAKRSKYGWMSVKKFENRFGKGILHSVEESIDLFKQQIV